MRAAGLLRPGGVLVMEHDHLSGAAAGLLRTGQRFGQAHTGETGPAGPGTCSRSDPDPGSDAVAGPSRRRSRSPRRSSRRRPPSHCRRTSSSTRSRSACHTRSRNTPVSRTPHVAVLEPDRMHRRQQLVQYRGSAGMVSPRQRVEPGAQVACALSHSGELGVGGIVEFAGEHFLALAGGYGRVSPPYRHMRPRRRRRRPSAKSWRNGAMGSRVQTGPPRRGGERTRGVGPCTGYHRCG